MRTISLLFSMLLLILPAWNCQKDEDPPHFSSKLEHREFTSQALVGNPAGNSALRNLTVYTPEGYDPAGDTEYPVVYLLHVLPMTDSAFIVRETWDPWINPNGMFKTYPDFPEEGFRLWVDQLIASGKIDPMIIVMPDAGAKPYLFSFYSNSALNGAYEDYIANDLVNYIDANYRTIASKEGRAVIGFSQGGYGAFKLGLKHTQKFNVVAAHGAPLLLEALSAATPLILAENPDGMTGPHPAKFMTSTVYAMAAAWSPNLQNPPFFVDLPFEYPSGAAVESVMNRWREHDPFTLLNTYGAAFKTLGGIYFDTGASDEFGFGATYDYFRQALDAQGINYTYEVFDGGHFDKMFSRLEVSLGFCSGRLISRAPAVKKAYDLKEETTTGGQKITKIMAGGM